MWGLLTDGDGVDTVLDSRGYSEYWERSRLISRVPGLAVGKPTGDYRKAISPALGEEPPTTPRRKDLRSAGSHMEGIGRQLTSCEVHLYW